MQTVANGTNGLVSYFLSATEAKRGCKAGAPIKTTSSPDSPADQNHDQSIPSSIRQISLHLIGLQHSQPLPSSCGRHRNEVQIGLFDMLLIFHINICVWSSSSNRKQEADSCCCCSRLTLTPPVPPSSLSPCSTESDGQRPSPAGLRRSPALRR